MGFLVRVGNLRNITWKYLLNIQERRGLSLSKAVGSAKAVGFDRTFGELSRAAQPTPPQSIEMVHLGYRNRLPKQRK